MQFAVKPAIVDGAQTERKSHCREIEFRNPLSNQEQMTSRTSGHKSKNCGGQSVDFVVARSGKATLVN